MTCRIVVLLLACILAPLVRAQCPTSCDPNDLRLVEVSCRVGDGRTWVRLECGSAKSLDPYDWQILPHGATVFVWAWERDPAYAYVQGDAGTYYVQAHTRLGALQIQVTHPPVCVGLPVE